MAGVTRLELATSGVTGDPAVKLAENHASFYRYKQRLKCRRVDIVSVVNLASTNLATKRYSSPRNSLIAWLITHALAVSSTPMISVGGTSLLPK